MELSEILLFDILGDGTVCKCGNEIYGYYG
jgi:hypothetical protein